jgi:hypothetical protein
VDLLAQPDDLQALGEEGIPDDRARFLLAGATGTVRRVCGWEISTARETFTLDGTGGRLLLLPTLLLRDVAGVRVNGSPVTSYGWSSHGVLEGSWPRGRRNVTVDVVHGYDPVPTDVVQLVASLALRAHLNPAAALSESFAGSSTSWGPADWATASRYTIPGES